MGFKDEILAFVKKEGIPTIARELGNEFAFIFEIALFMQFYTETGIVESPIKEYVGEAITIIEDKDLLKVEYFSIESEIVRTDCFKLSEIKHIDFYQLSEKEVFNGFEED